MKNNIILIGMPGCGKSTGGVVLAKRLGKHFIDTDLIIQDKCGKRLSELIAENGVAGFKEIENKINSEVQADNAVIATGGSAVYGKEAMAHFKEIGTVVYLKLSLRKSGIDSETLKKEGWLWKRVYPLQGFIMNAVSYMKNMQI